MNGLIAITVSVLPFLWLFHAFEMVPFSVSLPVFGVALLGVLALILVKVRNSKAAPRVRRMRIGQTAKKAVMDNIHMLAVNQTNLVKVDDYGNRDLTAVNRDMARFIEYNIAKRLDIELTDYEKKKLCDIIRQETRRYRKNNPSLFVEYAASMDQDAYERFCEGLLKVDGWKTRLLPPEQRPEGVDLVGEKDGMIVAFQIRKAERPVGNRGVNVLNDNKDSLNATHAVIICNEEFVPSARNLASSLGVELWHHSDIGEGFR